MISLPYVQAMVAYNSAMNLDLYAVAGRLSDAERRRDRGAFWRSIHGTFSHLVWADLAWMARFDGWQPPAAPLDSSGDLFDSFADMAAARADTDRRIEAWAAGLDAAWLVGDLSWFSASAGRDMTKQRGLLVMHLFNHQTHHRGQAHAMLTAAGEKTGPTDLPFVVALGERRRGPRHQTPAGRTVKRDMPDRATRKPLP